MIINLAYNILGKEQQLLLNQKLNAGKYIMNWDGSKYSSGEYFYTIELSDFIETKRMILLK